MRTRIAIIVAALLSGCATTNVDERHAAPTEVKIIALNDFHGALEPPGVAVPAIGQGGETIRVPAGGAAYLGSAVQGLKAKNPNHIVVSAGDLISASPLISAQFLDEPTILAMNLIGLDINAVGNHEFDRGRAELLRMQNGGCEKNTNLEPCRVDAQFEGAQFGFLAANVRTEEGATLFPSHMIRSFGSGASEVQIAFIGLTLEGTPTLVQPAGIEGLRFEDEAATINALIPQLRAQGVDAVVVVIHQGLSTKVGYDDKSCGGIDGDLLPILARLDPEVDLVVSGHTHNAYICDHGRIDPARPFLVTSAGRSGTLLTDITLAVDPKGGVVARNAEQVIVQGEGFQSGSGEVPVTDRYPRFSPAPDVAALVERYRVAVEPLATRVVGRIAGPALRQRAPSGETVLGNLIADAHLAAGRSAGAVIAFTNGSGVRADIVPAADGAVTYGQIFTTQPFGNGIMVKSFTGDQLRRVLEQQFDSGWNTVESPNMLAPSAGFSYRYDLRRPSGERVTALALDGVPIDPKQSYRVAMNSFLAGGGDNFTIFRNGTDATGAGQDIDVLEAYLTSAGTLQLPAANRVVRAD